MENESLALEAQARAINPTMEPFTVASIYDRILSYRARAKAIEEVCEAALVEWIKTNGPLQIGNGVSYYLSHPKDTKCNDVKGAIDAIGQYSNGEPELFLGCFSSSAIKHGAARKVLPPEVFEKLFTTTVKDKLESGEPAPKRITKADAKFLR